VLPPPPRPPRRARRPPRPLWLAGEYQRHGVLSECGWRVRARVAHVCVLGGGAVAQQD
jgi:hypothetical protein